MIIIRQNNYCEKLYSTGDKYLDDLLEKAFCEGYEYAQKEFGILSNFADRYIDNLDRVNEEYENYKPKSEKEIINSVKKKANSVKNTFKTAGQKAKSLFKGKQLVPAFVKV